MLGEREHGLLNILKNEHMGKLKTFFLEITLKMGLNFVF